MGYNKEFSEKNVARQPQDMDNKRKLAVYHKLLIYLSRIILY